MLKNLPLPLQEMWLDHALNSPDPAQASAILSKSMLKIIMHWAQQASAARACSKHVKNIVYYWFYAMEYHGYYEDAQRIFHILASDSHTVQGFHDGCDAFMEKPMLVSRWMRAWYCVHQILPPSVWLKHANRLLNHSTLANPEVKDKVSRLPLQAWRAWVAYQDVLPNVTLQAGLDLFMYAYVKDDKIEHLQDHSHGPPAPHAVQAWVFLKTCLHEGYLSEQQAQHLLLETSLETIKMVFPWNDIFNTLVGMESAAIDYVQNDLDKHFTLMLALAPDLNPKHQQRMMEWFAQEHNRAPFTLNTNRMLPFMVAIKRAPALVPLFEMLMSCGLNANKFLWFLNSEKNRLAPAALDAAAALDALSLDFWNHALLPEHSSAERPIIAFLWATIRTHGLTNVQRNAFFKERTLWILQHDLQNYGPSNISFWDESLGLPPLYVELCQLYQDPATMNSWFKKILHKEIHTNTMLLHAFSWLYPEVSAPSEETFLLLSENFTSEETFNMLKTLINPISALELPSVVEYRHEPNF